MHEGWSLAVEEKPSEQVKWWRGIRAEAAADGIIQEDNTYAEARAVVNRDSLSGYLGANSIACICLCTASMKAVTWQSGSLFGKFSVTCLNHLLGERDKMLQAMWTEEKKKQTTTQNKTKQQNKHKCTRNNVKLIIFSDFFWNLGCQRQVLLK